MSSTPQPHSTATDSPSSRSSPCRDVVNRDGFPSNTVAHSWFAALDRRHFGIGANRWTILVTGIHVLDGDVWIQVQCANNRLRSCVVHVTSGTSLLEGLTTIERSINEAEASYQRLRVPAPRGAQRSVLH
jgi:hypothetical protein